MLRKGNKRKGLMVKTNKVKALGLAKLCAVNSDKNTRVILISYASGETGHVLSEWLKDKVRAFEELETPVTLITSTSSSVNPGPNTSVIRVPSVGWRDFSSERDSLSLLLNPKWRPGGRIRGWLWMVFAQSFGRLFDFIFLRLAGSHSEGRWSWFLTAAPIAFWIAWKEKGSILMSTGGPSVAHLVAMVAASLARRKFVCEAQDPILGTRMSLSELASGVLRRFEGSLARRAQRMVFVTKEAARRAQDRHPESGDRIVAIYPGAYNFGVVANPVSKNREQQIVLAHLGHLYGTRNLDLLFRAIDELVKENKLQRGLFQVWSIGPAYVPNRSAYLARSDYLELSITDRVSGLRRAAEADFLLLVQHSDSRSQETIPFKIYDYLNLALPVFGIVGNSEINDLLKDRGVFASTTNLAETKAALLLALEVRGRWIENRHLLKPPLVLRQQLKQIFE